MLKNLTIQGIGVRHRPALEDPVAAVDHLDRGGFGKIVVGVGVKTRTYFRKMITIVSARRNPMQKPFTAIVPPSLKATSETYQFAPAVRIGNQILISGIVGVDAEGRLPPDFRSQATNVFTTLEAILEESGATLDDVASLNSYHVGDLHSQLRELVDVKATRIRPPHPIWTGVGVTQLGVPGALLEISAVAVARD
jgi:enamine deaminase RidA (YjgF/YER057c/UK114 family)